jgi:hypothetical protein
MRRLSACLKIAVAGGSKTSRSKGPEILSRAAIRHIDAKDLL